MNEREQQKLRQALEENFPERSIEEREDMFYTLLETGGTKVSVPISNSQVMGVGVGYLFKEVWHYVYYRTKAGEECDWYY